MRQAPFIIALILGITVHEFSHAFIANTLGDPTPALMGRLTLNPFAHLDFWGTIMLIFAGIGWGKPVPFNPLFLNNPILGGGLIALAGPASNFLLAAIFSLIYRRSYHYKNFSEIMILMNLRLMAFNLIPLPPLDGSKALGLLLPTSLFELTLQYQEIGFIILFLLVFSPFFTGKEYLFSKFIDPITTFIWRKILYLP